MLETELGVGLGGLRALRALGGLERGGGAGGVSRAFEQRSGLGLVGLAGKKGFCDIDINNCKSAREVVCDIHTYKIYPESPPPLRNPRFSTSIPSMRAVNTNHILSQSLALFVDKNWITDGSDSA